MKNQRDDFEEQYQILLVKDYKEADEYRNKTTEVLKKKHTDLEEERDSAKDQIMEMHKERVAANINQLVKNATVNFWLVMKKSKLSVSIHNIFWCYNGIESFPKFEIVSQN